MPPYIVGRKTATELWVGAGERIRKSLPRGSCDRRILVTTKTEYGWRNIFSRTREHHNHPQTIRTVIASAPYRYRSFSRERTHMDLEDPNGVSEWKSTTAGAFGLPLQLLEFQTW